jgi:SpoVK/Ycf46/Vps4 family AAA+-type ATPase
LGSTAKNIGDLFDMASERDEPLVLFIDEFDAIAPQRGRTDQAVDEERNQYVNTLLQRLEQHNGFVIAATNFGKNIDRAIWRRFDIHITLDLPGQPERERIFARYLAPFGLPAHPLKQLAEAFESASPALIRSFCENVKRQIIVGPKLNSDMRKASVIERILASVHPHPDLGKPRLWSLGAKDEAVRALPWPLPKAADLPAEDAAPRADNVVRLP